MSDDSDMSPEDSDYFDATVAFEYAIRGKTAADIGKSVGDLLDAQGKTQLWLAETIGTPASHLSQVLAGKKALTRKLLVRIASALRVEEAALIPVHLVQHFVPKYDPVQRPSSEPEPRLPNGLADYFERHGDELRPVVAEQMRQTMVPAWLRVPDDEFWSRVADFWEFEFARARNLRAAKPVRRPDDPGDIEPDPHSSR